MVKRFESHERLIELKYASHFAVFSYLFLTLLKLNLEAFEIGPYRKDSESVVKGDQKTNYELLGRI